MKSEERHQLLTNDLGVVTERTVGFFERHLGTIAGIVGAALLVGGLAFWWTRSADTEVETGWTLLRSAKSLDDFGIVIDKYKDKPAGHWAQLIVSEANLKTAVPLMFTNRELALTDLKSARKGFESLVQGTNVDPTIRERALWGLALSLETTSDGNTAKIIEAYEKLLSDFPETIFKSVADDRIAMLKKDNAKEFYAWFSKENPKPPEARPRDFKNEGSGLLEGANSKEDSSDVAAGVSNTSETLPALNQKTDAEEKPADSLKPDEAASSEGEGKSAEPKQETPNEEPTKKD